MLAPVEYPSRDAEEKLRQIAARKPGADPSLERDVREILDNVKLQGDKALLDYTRRFDAPGMTADQFTVTDQEIDSAYQSVEDGFLAILRRAVENIEAFHTQQLRPSYFVPKPDGSFLGQIVRPLASAGLYIPGGKGGETPLISSVLMNGIPARLAGVPDVAMVSPPRQDGTLDPHLLVAAREVGVGRIHKVGSAWAIGALAHGTTLIPPVDVIVGPGNIYVALAKRLVSGEVSIDLIAGPSEILVIADDGASPACVAADLLSQAEHDAMASAILITTDTQVARQTAEYLEAQMARLPRRAVVEEALNAFGAVFLVENLGVALDLANRIAPEHLELQVRDPWALLGKVRNAGAVFLGNWTPEAVGDYFAGPNHVLPTAGSARFASALGVDSFLKRTSVIAYSKAALERDAEAIVRMAEMEGLEAHAASVRMRFRRGED